MKSWNKDQIIENLKKEGLSFTQFLLTHEGQYSIEDADWNYKDVPHLHHIHQLVEAYFTTMSDDLITTINMQKVLGLKLPLCVTNYQSGKNEQTYYTTWLFFILIVRTSYEFIETNKTRVITNYNIGSTKLLKWLHPFIRFLIKRNYKDLMQGDIPMRERRGLLRKWGYSFYKSSEHYSFPKTMEIRKNNVIPPKMEMKPFKISKEEFKKDGEYFYGRNDHWGFRIVAKEGYLHIFSRMCPHEGASLDESPCVGLKLKCPWHGRLHTPLASFDTNSDQPQEIILEKYTFKLTHDFLYILMTQSEVFNNQTSTVRETV